MVTLRPMLWDRRRRRCHRAASFYLPKALLLMWVVVVKLEGVEGFASYMNEQCYLRLDDPTEVIMNHVLLPPHHDNAADARSNPTTTIPQENGVPDRMTWQIKDAITGASIPLVPSDTKHLGVSLERPNKSSLNGKDDYDDNGEVYPFLLQVSITNIPTSMQREIQFVVDLASTEEGDADGEPTIMPAAVLVHPNMGCHGTRAHGRGSSSQSYQVLVWGPNVTFHAGWATGHSAVQLLPPLHFQLTHHNSQNATAYLEDLLTTRLGAGSMMDSSSPQFSEVSHITVENIRAEQERIIADAADDAAADVLSSVSETNTGVLEESELAVRRAEIANRPGMHDSHISKETWARRQAKLDRLLSDYGPGSAQNPPGTGDLAHNPFITRKFPHVASLDTNDQENEEQEQQQDEKGWQQQWRDQYDTDIPLDVTRYSYAIFFLCLVLLLGKCCLGGDLQELFHLQQLLPTHASVKGHRDL